MKKIIVILLSVLVGLGIGCGYLAWRYATAPFDGPEARWVYLPAGISRDALADTLASALGSRAAARVCRIYNMAVGDSAIIRGAYLIQPGTPAKDIAKSLVRRQQAPVRLTFNNIRTIEQLAARIDEKLDISADDFIEACRTVLPAAGFTSSEQYPAAFIPDTYEFYWDASADKVVNRLLQARNAFWTDERRAQAKALGLTPVKVATIASIAEEETNNVAERKTVARLYLNRLDKQMLLQADPTVKFAVGDFTLRRITRKHLATPSPYNTYLNPGLPPGPIRIPEKTTLLGVLDAPAHTYLYMCARPDNSGLHNFATTFARHQQNAQAYQRWLNSRGIR